MFDHQNSAVEHMVKTLLNTSSCLLLSYMGSGKNVMVLETAVKLKVCKTILFVSPAYTEFKNDISKFYDTKDFVVVSFHPNELHCKVHNGVYDMIVYDEFHLYHKRKSYIKFAAAATASYTVYMTGTSDADMGFSVDMTVNMMEASIKFLLSKRPIIISKKLILSDEARFKYSKYAEEFYNASRNTKVNIVNRMRLWLSKTRLMHIITYMKNEINMRPDIKIVVFSDFNSILFNLAISLEPQLVASAFAGSSSSRLSEIKRFFGVTGVAVLLASIASCSHGCNFGEADVLLLAESPFSKVAFQQTVARITRANSKKKQKVVTMVFEDTIESRLLDSYDYDNKIPADSLNPEFIHALKLMTTVVK